MWCNVYGFFMFHEVLLSQSLWPLVDYKKQVALPWHWILPPLLQNEGTRPNSIPNQTNMSKNLHLLKKKTVALRFFSFLGKTKIHLPSALFIAPSLWLVFFTFGLRAVLKSNCSGIRQQCVQTPHFHYDWVTKNNCWESSSWAFFFCWKIFPGWSHTFDILLLLLATFVPSPAVCHAPQQVLQCQLVLRCPYGASQNIKSINPIFSSCLVKHGQGSQWRLQNCLTVNKHQQDSKVPSFIYTPLRISPKKQVSPIVFFENPGFISSFYC